MFCEDGEILRTAVSNVKRLSQITMLNVKKKEKRKPSRTILEIIFFVLNFVFLYM